MPAVVFLTALVTLALEVFYTRLFAALFWKDTAFAILSLAMLGIGASGVLVYLRREWFPPERTERQVAAWAFWFAASILVSYFTVRALSRTEDNMLAPIWGYGPLIFVGLLPFFCGGVILSIVFTNRAADIARLYLFDLAGAAVGAALVLPLLTVLNGPAIVPVLALAMALSGAVFAFRTGHRSVALLNAGGVVATAALTALHFSSGVLSITHSHGKQEMDVMHERWDALARITVRGAKPNSVWINIDSRVVTAVLPYSGKKSVGYLEHNVLQLAYHLRKYPRIVIIGPGGGSDVVSALTFGNTDITAVEVNRSIVDLMRNELREHSGGIYDNDAVNMVIADGRAYVAGMHDKVDLIQATFIDTFTAANSGAHTLSENYLYTTDAANDFLDHLNDDGVLSLSRWGGVTWGWAETHRTLAILARALRDRGFASPGDHFVVARGPSPEQLTVGAGYQNRRGDMEGMTTLLTKKSPFTDAELDRIQGAVDAGHFEPLWLGKRGGAEPILRRLLLRDDPRFFTRYAKNTGLDVTPVTDDRPFFFDMIRPVDALFGTPDPAWTTNPSYFVASIGVAVLSQLLAATSLLAFLLILVPLLLRVRDVRGVARPASTLGFFVCLGLGYIGIEISMMQRFALLLEHPVYAMVVVLGSMLLFSGLGSLSTSRLSMQHAHGGALRAGALVLVLAAYGVALPFVTRALMGLPLAVRVLLAAALAFPPSFLMGTLFPLGIASVRGRAPRIVPWVWGLNSSFSVVGAILSLFIAMSYGHMVTWYTFVAVYALAAVALLRMRGVEAVAAAADL